MKIAELFMELGIEPDMAALRAVDKYLGKAEKKAQGMLQRFNVSAGKLVGGIMKTGLLAAGAALTGVFVTGAKDALDFEKTLVRLKISAGGSAGTVEQMRDQMLAVSSETGVAKEEIAAATARFVALTGKGKDAALAMKTFARVSKASGTPMDDIARAAASMSTNLKIDPRDFEQAFSILIAGGKAGAVELNEFAGLIAELSPAMAKFKGGASTKGLATLSSALQITMRGAGSAGEASTKLKRFLDGLTSARAVKALSHLKGKDGKGIKVFDTKTVDGRKITVQRDLLRIIADMDAAGVFQNASLLNKVFESSEAKDAAIQIGKVRGEVAKMTAETLNAKDAAQDYQEVQASNAAKVERAWNNVQIALAKAFTPDRIERFTNALIRVLEFASNLVDTLADAGSYLDAHEKGVDAFNQALREGKSFSEAKKIGEAVVSREAERYGDQKVKHDFVTTAAGEQGRVSRMEARRRVGASDRAVGVDSSVVVNITVPPGTDQAGIAAAVTRQIKLQIDNMARQISAAAGNAGQQP